MLLKRTSQSKAPIIRPSCKNIMMSLTPNHVTVVLSISLSFLEKGCYEY